MIINTVFPWIVSSLIFQNLSKKYCRHFQNITCIFFRFCRDGHGSVLEPKGKKFYADGMTQKFEGLESEWPIFHAFMVIDGVFKNLDEQVEYHQSQLKKLIKYTDKGGNWLKLQLLYQWQKSFWKPKNHLNVTLFNHRWKGCIFFEKCKPKHVIWAKVDFFLSICKMSFSQNCLQSKHWNGKVHVLKERTQISDSFFD